LNKRTITVAVVVTAIVAAGAAALTLRSNRRDPFRAGATADLARTRSYLASWSKREKWDRFPESPAFAFSNAYARLALGETLSPAERARIVDYLRSCQQSDGGFSPTPELREAHVVPTYHALGALALLGALDSIDRDRAASFLLGLSRPDGGFAGRTEERAASLATTFHAVASLELLGAAGRIERQRVAAFVGTYREPGKGFGLAIGVPSSSTGTAMAVRVLAYLGAVPEDVRRDATAFLGATRYAGHLREGAFPTPPTLAELRQVLEALDELGSLDRVDRPELQRFIASLYIAENGGFGPEPGLGTTPPSTGDAIACLVLLGRLPAPVVAPRPT
jgi:prenyltransferase beta subunit